MKHARAPIVADPYAIIEVPATASPPSPVAQPVVAFHLFSYVLGLLTALVLVGGSTLLLYRADPAPIVLQPPPTLAPSPTPLPTATPAPIMVFVSGAVLRPGLYGLAADARVADAVAAAGGLAAEANAAIVNQAERLWDGVQVHVPSLAATTTLAPEPPSGVSGNLANSDPAAATSGSGGLININTATATELETLPGIGPSKAAAIIANRPYNAIDELDRVPGIGVRTLEQLRPLVTVQ
ncbi:MAG: ComEA family DNA-binding protein [Caldilineaceae bacterium]|nr:ComEA family DNA-binding protein [Caldilineaceae bacterium]